MTEKEVAQRKKGKLHVINRSIYALSDLKNMLSWTIKFREVFTRQVLADAMRKRGHISTSRQKSGLSINSITKSTRVRRLY